MIKVIFKSIAGPNLFHFSKNHFFFFVSSASVYNFADDNYLSATAKTVAELKNTSQFETEFQFVQEQ